MRGLRHYGPYLLVILIVAIGYFQFARPSADAAPKVNVTENDVIPAEAIRIRIIANSDSEHDQAIKRQVRDDVAALIESWGAMPDTIEEARALLNSHLAEVQKVASSTLKREKAGYSSKTVLAKVDFPAKTFEGKNYPAGRYEALRVTLGDGKGANWWCVLFPPLCLTAATKADASEVTASKSMSCGTSETVQKTISSKEAECKASAQPAKLVHAEPVKPHTEFFLWVLLKKLIAFLKALFA